MPPKAKPKAKIGRTSKIEAEGTRKSVGTPLLGTAARKSRGVARGPSKHASGSSEQSTPLLAAPDNDAPSLPSDHDTQNEILQSPASASHQAPRKPKRKAHPKAKQHDQKVDEDKQPDEVKPDSPVDVRGSLFIESAEDPAETTATQEHVDLSHPKAVPKKKVVRKQKTQAGESVDTRMSLTDKRLSTVQKVRVSDPGPRRAHPKPFLAGLSPQTTRSSLSPGDGDTSAPGKVSIRQRPSRLSVRTQKILGPRQTETRVPHVSLAFRFLNYNMANRGDANLDDVAVGFQELQRARTQVIGPLSQSSGALAESNATEDESFIKKAEDAPMIASMSQKLPTEHRNLAKLLLEGAQFESIFMQDKDLDQGVERRARLSTEFDIVEEVQDLPKAQPKKDPELAQKRRSSQNAESKPQNTEAKPQKKVLKFNSADVRAVEDETSKEKNGKILNQSTKMMSTTSMKSMASSASGRSTRPAPKKKSLFRSFTRKAPTRKGTFLHRSMNVDCIFGVLCETQFPLEEMAEVLNEEVVNGECHTLSAQQMVNEQGAIAGVRGYAAATLCGDLKTITMIRENMEEGTTKFVETGKTISPCDDKGNNPMKSFLVRSFDVECSGDSGAVDAPPKLGKPRTLRVLCLGSHFPMKKVASLMQEQETSDESVLQKTKYMLAKLLKKALQHLLEEEKLSKNSIVLLQGDLNSRCVLHGGRFLDIIWETLHDHNLQQFISMGLPSELRGEWREVVQFQNSGELPVTYRFDQKQPASVARGKNLQLSEVFGSADESATSYRNVLETIRSNGILKEWGLYDQKLDDESTKFKPSRLPACTERVLYYAPANLGDCCWWSSSEGYEVNYLQAGSDHKPVVLEATLNIGRRRESSRALSTFNTLSGLAPEEIENALGELNWPAAEDSESTSESDAAEDGSRRKRTALRLSVDGDMSILQSLK